MKRRQAKVSYSSKIGRRNSRRRSLKTIALLLVPLLLIGSLIYVLRLDSLQIKTVEVEGVVALNSDDIQNAALESIGGNYLWIIPKSSIFLVDGGGLEQTILGEFARVQNVNVSKSISGSLKIKIAERTSSGVWCSGSGACYLFDSLGLVFARAGEEDVSGKVVFKGVLQGDPLLKKFGTEAEMKNYFEVLDHLQSGGLEVSSLYVESTDKATIATSMGDIIFTPTDPNVNGTCENVLLLISNERGRNPEAQFQYIDARFGNKLFYKVL